jgi:hypothetical protein
VSGGCSGIGKQRLAVRRAEWRREADGDTRWGGDVWLVVRTRCTRKGDWRIRSAGDDWAFGL